MVDQLMTVHCVWSPACPVTPIWAAHSSLPYLESLRADYLFLTVKEIFEEKHFEFMKGELFSGSIGL